MKPCFAILGFLLIGLFGVSPVYSDEAGPEKTPELRGVLADESGKRFGLFIPGSGETGWATVGQAVGGWKLKEYRAADDTLVLVKDGREEILHLSESVVGVYHKGSQADAETLLKAMKFRERMEKEFAKSREQMLRQLLKSSGLANPTPAQLAEFQEKVAGIFNIAQFDAKLAEAMGAVYTQEELKAQTDFYASDTAQAALDQWGPGAGFPNGEEPAALKTFYATPAGAAVKAKQAQLNTQMQKTIGPWIGGAMKDMQQAATDFAKSQGADPQPAGWSSATAKVTPP